MEMKIAKFELYPEEFPTGYAVGFNVKANNGRSIYRDCLVTYNNIPNNSTDNDIINIAWINLQEEINTAITDLETHSSLIGNIWTPTTLEEEVVLNTIK